jgi:hypothetical protein
VIDVRDVMARVEELETTLEDAQPMDDDERILSADGSEDLTEQLEEFQRLTALLSDLEGNGGDEEWRGAWYPITLVCDSYFESFAQDEAESLGLINNEVRWPYTCINWEQAAEDLKSDYSTVEFDGITYWYR